MHQSSSLDCCVCYQRFNLSDRLPRHIPRCCHTLCTTCILRILSPHSDVFKCPVDNLPIEKPQRGLDDFKPNYIVQDLLHEQSAYDFCTTHPSKELEYVCLTEKVKICAHCVILGDHRNEPGQTTHDVRQLKDFEPLFKAKIKELEGTLKGVDQRYQNVENMLEQERKTMQKTIENRFEDFAFILRSKEKQLALEIDAFFKGELERFKLQIGKDAVLRQDLKDKIIAYKNITKNSDVFTLLEQDTAPLCNRAQAFIHNEESFSDMKQLLKDLNTTLDESLTVQLNSLNKLQAVDGQYLPVLKDIYSQISEKLFPDSDQETQETSVITVKSRFDIEVIDTKLKIRHNSQDQMELEFDLQSWKNIESLSIEILGNEDLDLSQDDLKTFGFICNTLTNVHKIEIFTRGQRNIPENSLITFLSTLFWKPGHLTAIELHINSHSITHKTTDFLVQQVLNKVNDLKDLAIIFENSQISSEAFRDLTEAVSIKAEGLRTLYFMIPGVNIVKEAILPLFVAMPNVVELGLDLSYGNLGDRELEGFIKNTVASFGGLKILRLYLQRTRISDESVRGILEGISEEVLEGIEDLKMNLSMTRITNKSLEGFVKKRLEKMKELKTIYIAVDGTFVNNSVKGKLKIK